MAYTCIAVNLDEAVVREALESEGSILLTKDMVTVVYTEVE